jgi:hypothetical protein
MKECSNCGNLMESFFFHKDKQNQDGLSGICRACSKQRYREYILRKARGDFNLTSNTPWENPPVPRNYWREKKNRVNYLIWLGNKLGYQDEEDWYQIDVKIFKANNGNGLLHNYYDASPLKALQELYPDYQWLPWMFNVCPHGYWEAFDNRLKYMEWLEKQLGYEVLDDWHKVSWQDFHDNFGGGLLNTYFGGSPVRAVIETFRDRDWLEWDFVFSPQNFWKTKDNRIKFMVFIQEKYKFRTVKDWYQLTYKHFEQIPKGESFLANYNSSPIEALREFMPGEDWKEWLFPHPPKHFWENKINRVNFLKWFGDEFELKKPEDWYDVDVKLIIEMGGRGILRNSGLHEIVHEIYPDHEWLPWLFSGVPNGYWLNGENLNYFFDHFCKKENIKKPEDLYRITHDMVYEHKGAGWLDAFEGSVIKMALHFFPEYDWDFSLFSIGLKNQRRLFESVCDVFGKDQVRWNYKHPELLFENGRRMELDIFIPSRNLAIEYQGEQHYEVMPHWGGGEELSRIQDRDQQKRDACKGFGIELIEISYNSKMKVEELRGLLNQYIATSASGS